MRKKVALVLSGGGARGIAHIGAIEELEKAGYEISSIAGTSMGAVVGGVYAQGKLEEFKEWMLTLDRKKVFSLVDFTLSRQGLVKGDKVFQAMQEFIPDKDIRDLKIPYAAVAVDLNRMEEVVFRSGSLYEAIRASVAIPTVLKPVEKGDALLVDGGVMNNIPVDVVIRHRRDKLVVVNVNANIPKPVINTPAKEAEKSKSIYNKKIREFQAHLKKILPEKEEDDDLGYFDLVSRTISSMIYHNAQVNLEKHSPDILIEVSRHSCGTYDFFKADELIEFGRMAAIKALND
ncbi:MAG: patatin-like phospholipase family protein [Marinilabiliaceae bacterium]|jgi:NTE family protein|nr:patatin-like phospholipase family protein [Marinilabiliaceae bacterium]